MANTISKTGRKKTWEDSIFSDNLKVMKEYLSAAQNDRSIKLKMENAKYGQQFSIAEAAQLLAFRQAPLAISISSAILDTADALQVSAKPTVDVAPIINPYDEASTKNSQMVAGIYKHAIQKDWFDSYGGLEYSKGIKDRTTAGTGIMYSIPRIENGEFKTDVKNVSWKFFIPDPASRDYLYRDSDNMIIAMPLSDKAAYKFVQSMEPDLSFDKFMEDWKPGGLSYSFPEEDKTFGNVTKEQMLFIQRLTLEVETTYLIIPKVEDRAPGQDLRFRTASTLDSVLKGKQEAGDIKIVEEKKLFLVEYTSVGNKGYKIVYPIQKYNCVPMHYDYRGTPYAYSLMYKLYPLQRALNKFIMSSILNMALLNTTKILSEENSIIDENNWIQSASQPNAILKYKIAVPGVSTPPEIVKPTPMDSAFLIMPQYLTQMMEYISGIYAPMQGNPQGSSDVFSTVASLQSAGGVKIKSRQADADASLSHFGSIMADWYQHFSPMNGYSYKIDEDGKESVMKYNELIVNTEDVDNIKIEVNPENDLRTGYKNVRFTSTGSMGYESGTEAALLTNLATQLKMPQLIPLVLDRLNIPGLKKVKDEIDVNKTLTSENNNLQGIVQEIERKNKTLEAQITQVSLNLTQAQAKGKLDVEIQKFKDDPTGYTKQAMTQQGEK